MGHPGRIRSFSNTIISDILYFLCKVLTILKFSFKMKNKTNEGKPKFLNAADSFPSNNDIYKNEGKRWFFKK